MLNGLSNPDLKAGAIDKPPKYICTYFKNHFLYRQIHLLADTKFNSLNCPVASATGQLTKYYGCAYALKKIFGLSGATAEATFSEHDHLTKD